MRVLFLLIPSLALASPCPHPARHHAPKLEFVRAHPCPESGKPAIHCHGYVIDHIVPLCTCGKDAAANMQWQTVAESKRKDQIERRQCREVAK